MCCSLHPASFSASARDEAGTTVVFSLAYHPIHRRLVHVLIYENRPTNLHDGPNAMLLHFPAQPMDEGNLIDTAKASHIARDCVLALNPPPPRPRGQMRLGALIGSAMPPAVRVFDSGIYTVLLAQDPRAIPAALERVPPNKRPAPNPEIFEWYAQWRPNWPLALCCFDNREATRAKPMMWWYDPLDFTAGFLPAIDAHDGHPPDLNAQVMVDHWAIFGLNLSQSHLMTPRMREALEQLTEVDYSDRLTALQEALVPTHVMGRRFLGRHRNGDFLAGINAITDGDDDHIRRGVLTV